MKYMPTRNKIGRLTRFLGTGLISVFVLLGCASGPRPYEIKAIADPVINRDVTGRPLSVVVHVYQLKDAGEFSKLTFDMLASGRPVAELLGKNLLEMNEIMLVPGGQYTGTDKVNQDAKHVGIVAFFRQPDQHYWRMLMDADQVRRSGLNFRVQDCYLSLNAPKPSLIPGQPEHPPVACAGNDVRAVSAVAAPAAAPARPGSAPQGNKRNSALDIGRQAAESILTKKP
jgi:type VI secretion system protein VasD